MSQPDHDKEKMMSYSLQRRKETIHALTLMSLFIVLMIVSAKVVIPVSIIPITLQVTIAILSGILLGPKMGVLAQITYVVMGLVGLPVFSSGGGPGYILTPTFGYLLGFIACSFVSGFLSCTLIKEKTEVGRVYFYLLLSSILALIVCYGFGILYLLVLSNLYSGFSDGNYSFGKTILVGVLPFIVKDGLLCVLASELARRLWRFRLVGTR